MKFLLAQAQLDAAPAEYVKWFFVCLFAVILVALAIFAAVMATRKAKPVKIDDNPEIGVRKAAKRYNHDLAEERHAELNRRLDEHDREIKEIQRSRTEALEKINRRFERVLLGLTIIGTKMGVRMPQKQEDEE